MLGGMSFSDEETTELEAELELLKKSSGLTPQDNLIFPIEPSTKITSPKILADDSIGKIRLSC